jgi:PqqD family protein of HPr-rel-A system
MHDPSHWHAAMPYALAWRRFDEEVVIYNDSTGSTHQLGALAGEVMISLLQNASGLAFPALLDDVTSRIDFAGSIDVAAEVQRTLDELSDLQLVSRSTA